MRKLYFSGRYYKRLVQGKKTVTIRLSPGGLKPGDVVEVYAGKKFVGKARIVKVEWRRVGDLNTEILKQEGFETLGELIEALMDHYGPQMADPDRKVAVIRFERL